MVPIKQVTEIVLAATGDIERLLRGSELHRKAEDVVRQAIRVRTTRLKRLQKALTLLTAVTAVVAASSQLLRLAPSADESRLPTYGIGFGAIAVLLGIVITFVSVETSRIQEAIEEAADALNDKTALVAVIYDILEASDLKETWTARQWHDGVEAWSRGSARSATPAFRDALHRALGETRDEYVRRMGPYEFSRLVLTKAMEHQVVDEEEVWVEGMPVVTFHLRRPCPSRS